MEDGVRRPGRPEAPLSGDGPVVELAARLRQVRADADTPSYKQMATAVHVSVSALAEAARGRQFPTWMVVDGYLRGCGVDPETWRGEYDALAERHKADRVVSQPAKQEDEPEATPEPAPAAPRRRPMIRRARIIGLAGVCAVVLLVVLTSSIGTSQHLSPPQARLGAPATSKTSTSAPPTSTTTPTTTHSVAPQSAAVQPGTNRSSTSSQAPIQPNHATSPAPPATVHQNPALPTGPLLGPSCGSATDFYSYNDPQGDGWTVGATGGCGTAFIYTELNVNPSDPNQWQEDAGWTFRNVPQSSCTLNLWIPASPYASATAHYWATTGSQNYDDRITEFTIDQSAYQGRWYSAPITLSQPKLYLQIDDPGGTAHGQYITASTANLHC